MQTVELFIRNARLNGKETGNPNMQNVDVYYVTCMDKNVYLAKCNIHGKHFFYA